MRLCDFGALRSSGKTREIKKTEREEKRKRGGERGLDSARAREKQGQPECQHVLVSKISSHKRTRGRVSVITLTGRLIYRETIEIEREIESEREIQKEKAKKKAGKQARGKPRKEDRENERSTSKRTEREKNKKEEYSLLDMDRER